MRVENSNNRPLHAKILLFLLGMKDTDPFTLRKAGEKKKNARPAAIGR